jgi:nucleoside-diphosphate-sugar epimerase
MAVFISGGKGHIGSWMTRLLVEAGEDVLIYDIDTEIPDVLASYTERISFIQGDVLDYRRLSEVFRRHGDRIAGIVHTVGIMGEIVLEDPRRYAGLNINGTLNMLEIARTFGVRKLVYTSTGAVYGAVQGVASEEDHLPAPADLYAATKRSSELLGQQYAAAFDLDVRVGRVYFIYGPGRLPSRFVRLYRYTFGALEGLADLKLERGADQKLDFTYVEDAARGLVQLYQAPKPRHAVYNIASGQAARVGDVAELAARFSAFDCWAEIGPGTLMPRAEALDISRARKELGFEPRVGLEEGIERYAAWLKEVVS